MVHGSLPILGRGVEVLPDTLGPGPACSNLRTRVGAGTTLNHSPEHDLELKSAKSQDMVPLSDSMRLQFKCSCLEDCLEGRALSLLFERP